jgi:suppressor for copper-sensitivity B
MSATVKTAVLRAYLRKGFILFAVGIGLSASSASAVFAAATAWVNSDFSQIRLIAVGNADGQGYQAGLHIRLEPGWKTYWRTPGDSGVPTVVDWSASENISVTGMMWPVPHRTVVAGYQSFVYQDEVVLPVSVVSKGPGEKIRMVADVNYAVCREICVPLHAALSLDLKQGTPGRGDKVHRRLLEKYRKLVPVNRNLPGLSLASVVLVEGSGSQTLKVKIETDSKLVHPDIFIEAPQPFAFTVPAIDIDPSGKQATFTFVVSSGRKKLSLAGIEILVTVAEAGQAIEIAHRLSKN